MTDRYYDALWGSDRYSGRGPNEAKQSLQALNADLVTARPGDTFSIRNGSIYRGELKPTCRGQADAPIVITGYALGGEEYHAPVFITEGAKSRNVTLDCDHVQVRGIDLYGGETGVFVPEMRQGNAIVGGWIEGCGWGIAARSQILIEGNIFYRMRMARDENLDTDAGGVWVSLERHTLNPHIGSIVRGNTVLFAQAPSRKFKRDGGLEIFGGIEDALIEENDIWHTKGFIELGGKTELKQTIRNVIIRNNHVLNASGIALHVNSPADKFYADFEGLIFEDNRIDADDVTGKSAFWFVGSHGDLSRKLILRNNTISNRAALFGTDGKTDLGSITQEGNTYIRADGSKTLGVTLQEGNSFLIRVPPRPPFLSIARPTLPTLRALLRSDVSLYSVGDTVKILDGRMVFELDATRTWRFVRRMARPV